ncbi:hypothetical protein D9C73_001308 [Collichthys lucidus]|uniref:Uncharacterized protein n=1 Tax=Collichthys lucidus TaxID=240159 RepID=A0A4U5U112_COLLU|nr:hypothetical protein D9C73_001308 [Collichthys lucidus]
MHFTDLALANSWLLYRKDLTVCGRPKKNIMQCLEFQMEVAMTFLAQHDNDNSDFSEQEDDSDTLVQRKKRPVKAVPHVLVRRRANAHLPEVWCIGRQSSLVLCTYRVLITTNSLEPASSLEGIILNPITYRLRYATEAHNLSSCDG